MFDWRETQLLIQCEPHYVVLEVCNWLDMPFWTEEMNVPRRSLSSCTVHRLAHDYLQKG
jgi:hypothetical protein